MSMPSDQDCGSSLDEDTLLCNMTVDKFIVPTLKSQTEPTSTVINVGDEVDTIGEIINELKQMDEILSNTDTAHAGERLLDRDNLNFLCHSARRCPHVPTFHSVSENFGKIMPPTKQTFLKPNEDELLILEALEDEAMLEFSTNDEEGLPSDDEPDDEDAEESGHGPAVSPRGQEDEAEETIIKDEETTLNAEETAGSTGAVEDSPEATLLTEVPESETPEPEVEGGGDEKESEKEESEKDATKEESIQEEAERVQPSLPEVDDVSPPEEEELKSEPPVQSDSIEQTPPEVAEEEKAAEEEVEAVVVDAEETAKSESPIVEGTTVETVDEVATLVEDVEQQPQPQPQQGDENVVSEETAEVEEEVPRVVISSTGAIQPEAAEQDDDAAALLVPRIDVMQAVSVSWEDTQRTARLNVDVSAIEARKGTWTPALISLADNYVASSPRSIHTTGCTVEWSDDAHETFYLPLLPGARTPEMCKWLTLQALFVGEESSSQTDKPPSSNTQAALTFKLCYRNKINAAFSGPSYLRRHSDVAWPTHLFSDPEGSEARSPMSKSARARDMETRFTRVLRKGIFNEELLDKERGDRFAWQKQVLTHATRYNNYTDIWQTFNPLDLVKLKQGEKVIRLNRDDYHQMTEEKFKEQLLAVRAKMREQTIQRRQKQAADPFPESPEDKTAGFSITLDSPNDEPREVVLADGGKSPEKKEPSGEPSGTILQAKISLVDIKDPTPPATPVAPIIAKPRWTSNANKALASPSGSAGGGGGDGVRGPPAFLQIQLKKTGRLEKLSRKGMGADPALTNAEEPGVIKPSAARDMFERRAQQVGPPKKKAPEPSPEWFAKQVLNI